MVRKSSKKLEFDVALTQLAKDLEPFVPVILNSLTAIAAQFQLAVEKLAPALSALARVDWDTLKQRMEELPSKSQKAMQLASAKGWFFGWGDSLQELMELIDKIEVIDPNEIDAYLTQYYRDNLQFFADELASKHPHRASAINAAVAAHKTGDNGYFLSIPVFIAQADGLLTDITGEKVSALNRPDSGALKGADALSRRMATDADALALISPLLEMHKMDFMKNTRERREAEQVTGGAFTALNRHQVMHGESSDYGTEINSLKAFSFLAFVGVHLPLVIDSASAPP